MINPGSAVVPASAAVSANSSNSDSSTGKVKCVKNSRTVRARTVFPVGRIRRRLRDEAIAPRVRDNAAVAMTAVVDEVIGALMQDSIEATLANRRSRIKPRYISAAMHTDTTFSRLLRGTVPSAGVLPNIHSVLLPKFARGGKVVAA